MVSVAGEGVADKTCTHVLYGGAVRNDLGEIAVGQDLGLGGTYDGFVHGHLVIVIIGESIMLGIRLIRPQTMYCSQRKLTDWIVSEAYDAP